MAKYNTGIKVKSTNTAKSSPQNTSNKVFGRVVDIILDETHPLYEIYGGSQSINGVFYRDIEIGQSEDKQNSSLIFAYQGNTNLKQTPLIGEIVEIETLASENRENFVNAKKPYWTRVIPLWNNPHYNAYPDEIQNYNPETEELTPTSDGNFEEKGDITPLQSYPGDVIVEGRHSQGIRFSGTKYKSNPWIDGSNNGSPLTIISNGNPPPTGDFSTTIEDINLTSGSMYFAANHTIPLQQANYKVDSWEEPLPTANQYKGNQIIINSGRIFINAKEEALFLNSREAIGLSSRDVHLDADNRISLDGTKIYLGASAMQTEQEPVILGNQLEIYLRQLISELTSIAKAMTKAKTLDGKPILDLNFQGKISEVVLDSLNKQINPGGKSILKSKKTFTE